MENTSLTHEISVMQVKIMYLHYKSIRINENIRTLSSKQFESLKSTEALITRGTIVYDIVDVIALYENYHSFSDKMLKYNGFASAIPYSLKKALTEVRKRMTKWKHVRNKIGGHLDTESVLEFSRNIILKEFLSAITLRLILKVYC